MNLRLICCWGLVLVALGVLLVSIPYGLLSDKAMIGILLVAVLLAVYVGLEMLREQHVAALLRDQIQQHNNRA